MDYQLAMTHDLLLDGKQLEKMTVRNDIEAQILGERIYIVKDTGVTESD